MEPNTVVIDKAWVRRMLALMESAPNVYLMGVDIRQREAMLLAAQICPPEGSTPSGLGRVVGFSLEALETALDGANAAGKTDAEVAEVGRRCTTQLLVNAVLAGAIWGYIAGQVGLESVGDDADCEPGEIKIGANPTIN